MSDSLPARPPPDGAAPDERLLQLWRLGQRPDVRDFLAQTGELTPAQVLAVLQVDQRQRWESGERAPAETYLQWYPALRADPEHVLDLVYGEFLLREELGESPALDEYLQRFPDCAEQLQLQVKLHQALESGKMAPTVPVAASPDQGPAVAGYEILRELDRGGMGVVYLARQKGLNRLVALKMALGGGAANAEQLARFRAEAETAALLRHPNIVQIHEVGECAGRPYFTMEFLEGGSLAERLGGTPQPGRAAAELVETLARAMHYAHQHGVIHRDLKPANILLSRIEDRGSRIEKDKNDPVFLDPRSSILDPRSSVPKITDFGLAKHLVAGALQTQSGAILGTASYMAPEQAAGHARGVGPAVDVYALGAILYELLTGRPPFQAATLLETLELVRSAEPVPPRRLQPKLPRDLETICLKCLEKSPQKRYASAQELAEELHRFLHHEPIRARRTGPLGQGWRWCRRKPALAAVLACAAVLAVATVAVSTVSAWRLGVEVQRTRQAERDATEKLFRSTFVQAQALRKSGEMGQRFRSLEAIEEAVRIAQGLGVFEEHALALRNEAVACLALADLRVADEWDAPARWDWGGDCPTAFDAGLERYTFADEEGDVRIFRVADQHEIARLHGPGAKVRWVEQHFSADGRFLVAAYWFASSRPPEFVLWELGDNGPVRKIGPAIHTAFYAFSADGRRLAVTQPDRSITLHDLAGGGQRSLRPDRFATILAFRPDGRVLALGSPDDLTGVLLLDLETGQSVKHLIHPDDVRGLAWSADGRLLAASCDDRNVHVWDTEQGKEQAILEGHQRVVWDVAFSPVANLLASSAQDGTTRLWDPVSGRPLLVAPGKVLQISSDGQRLGFRRGARLGVWEVADGHECRVLHHSRLGNRSPPRNYTGPEMLHFSADGGLLASAADDGVRLWEVPGGREVAHLNAGQHEAALFHPDGTRLYTFGRTGLRCWPVRRDRGPGSLRVGPPEMLGASAGRGWFRGGQDGDGRLIAAAERLDDRSRLLVFPAKRPAERTVLGDNFNVVRIAVSPDGRWVAAGLVEPTVGIKVWDAQTGQLAWSSDSARVYVAFSPDGAWLVAGGGRDYGLWKVGSWEPGPVIPRDAQYVWAGFPAFRPDGRVLAVARSPQHLQLLDFASRQELATLMAPDLPCIDNWFCFSPDGRLLAVGTQSLTIQLWDLGAIGARLRALGLGCDLLPDSPVGPPAQVPPRVRVFQEVYEAEHLKVVDSTAWAVARQDLRQWGPHWSNGKHLFCRGPQGSFVELQVDVPEAGRYRLAVCFTLSLDYGVVETALDGRKIGGLFDGLHANTIGPTEKVEFGTFELGEGPHRLRFTVVDKNPQSPGYYMGIDYVQLTPVDGPAGGAAGAPPRKN
jgi:serine/threonine-protein kinase